MLQKFRFKVEIKPLDRPHPSVSERVVCIEIDTAKWDEPLVQLLRDRVNREVIMRGLNNVELTHETIPQNYWGIPLRLRKEIASWSGGRPAISSQPPSIPTPISAPIPGASVPVEPLKRCRIDEALASYLDSIRGENASRHVENKLSMLRRFLGTERVEQFVQSGNPKLQAQRLKCSSPAFFAGEFIDEITPTLLQQFFLQLEVSTKTKRHYREFFHHFLEFCIKFGHYQTLPLTCRGCFNTGGRSLSADASMDQME